jgi:hypothetical protein
MALPFNVDCLGISFFGSGEAARPPRLSEFRLAPVLSILRSSLLRRTGAVACYGGWNGGQALDKIAKAVL